MDLVLVEPPAATPLSLAQAKSHLKVEVEDEDLDIQGMIEGVTSALDGVEGWLGRALVEQTWAACLGGFPKTIELPLPPLREVVSIKYFDVAGVEQTLAADQYLVVDRGRKASRIYPAPGADWPEAAARPHAVRVTFKAGFAGVEAGEPPTAKAGIPGAILSAMRLMLADLYERREDGAKAEITTRAEDLLFRHRVGGVG